ncbi:hypothetical protein [Rhodohalobacter sp. SW132]|uniref:hypothetical protein n=1 Tax=Rhodohalobacter sp. SW132 TaxID=2293433 RepID=UPI0013141648|nr:hypothetical protein [Rhodohalobacter sp. SW132]
MSISFALLFSSCRSSSTDGDLSESLDPVEDVTPIEGAQNSTITVNRGPESYFVLEFNGIEQNATIQEGATGEGWCIDWLKPIDSNEGVYENVSLYSTLNVRGWNRLNYLLNIKEDLMSSDSQLTYREIQIAIWSLRGFPEFNMHEVAIEDLPPRMRDNGDPNFDYDKVTNILEIVESGYEDFEFTEGTKYAIIAETPADVQTVIMTVE